jgi:hypothetical protein
MRPAVVAVDVQAPDTAQRTIGVVSVIRFDLGACTADEQWCGLENQPGSGSGLAILAGGEFQPLSRIDYHAVVGIGPRMPGQARVGRTRIESNVLVRRP